MSLIKKANLLWNSYNFFIFQKEQNLVPKEGFIFRFQLTKCDHDYRRKDGKIGGFGIGIYVPDHTLINFPKKNFLNEINYDVFFIVLEKR